MHDPKPWRTARFDNTEQRDEFVSCVRKLTVEGIEVESLYGQAVRIRFRAPARVEVGVAGMITAHGGKVLPTVVQEESLAAVGG